MKSLLEYRRQRRVNRIVRNGKRLRTLVISQTELAEAGVADYNLDTQMRFLEERIERDKDFIRNTAAQEG